MSSSSSKLTYETIDVPDEKKEVLVDEGDHYSITNNDYDVKIYGIPEHLFVTPIHGSGIRYHTERNCHNN